MKAIIFSNWFEAPDELINFCKSIGYEKNYANFSSDFSIMFDSRVIEFCEQRLSNLWGEMVYKGRKTYSRKIGFAGAGYIREVDTKRKWRLRYNNVDAPIIDYVDIYVNTNEYGYTVATLISQ